MKRSLITVIISILFILGAVSCAESSTAPAAAEGCSKIAPPDGAQTVLIPGGTFKMGSPASDDSAAEDEFPEHDVALGCYTIYREEVTNSQYQQCVEAGVCLPVTVFSDDMTRRYGNTYYADYPVVGVDYNMASQYCAWIGGRLPTEAEWEYAATSTRNFVFPWGNQEADCEKAEFSLCHDPAETSATGLLSAGQSPFEVLDMAGNAWEWAFDWYAASYYSISPASNPFGPINGLKKVVRGGGYDSELPMLLSANRHAGNPYTAYSNVGFRCVLGADLDLPGNYQQPDSGTHNVPLGGDPVDDDDPQGDPGDDQWLQVSANPLDCPDANGDLHFRISVDSNNILWQLVSTKLEGDLFNCGSYDAASHSYTCNVSEPAATPEPNWHIELTLNLYDMDAQFIETFTANLLFAKPQACNLHNGPEDSIAIVDCPENGYVTIWAEFSPIIEWNTITNSFGENCIWDTWIDGEVVEIAAPDVLDNGKYRLHLEGTGDNGNYSADLALDPRQNCNPAAPQVEFHSACNKPTSTQIWDQVLLVKFTPADNPPEHVFIYNEVPCEDFAPGMLMCESPDIYDGLQGVLINACMDGNTNCVSDHIDIRESCDDSTGTIDHLSLGCDQDDGLNLDISFHPSETDLYIHINNQLWACENLTPTLKRCALPDDMQNDLIDVWVGIGGGGDYHYHMHAPSCSGDATDSVIGFECEGDTPALIVKFDPADAQVTAQLGGSDLYCAGGANGILHCVIPDGMTGTSQEAIVCVNDDCETETIQVESCTGDKPFAYEFCDSDMIKLSIVHDPADGFIDSVKVDGNPLDCYDQDDTNHVCTVPAEFAGQTKPVKVCKGIDCVTLSATFPDCSGGEGLSQNQCKIHDVECLSSTKISFLMDLYDKDTLEGVPIEDGSASAYMGNHAFDYVCANIPSVDGRIYCSGPFPGYAQFGIRVDFTLADTGEARWCGLDVYDWNDLLPGCAGSEPEQPDEPSLPVCSSYPYADCPTDRCYKTTCGGVLCCSSTP